MNFEDNVHLVGIMLLLDKSFKERGLEKTIEDVQAIAKILGPLRNIVYVNLEMVEGMFETVREFAKFMASLQKSGGGQDGSVGFYT